MMTWKGALLLTGLISLVAVFNVTVFFVLRSAFWASSSETTQILKNPVISKSKNFQRVIFLQFGPIELRLMFEFPLITCY